MESILKQNTAANVTIFLAASSDHISGKTGLNTNTITILASRAGAAPASLSVAVTELNTNTAPGLYGLAFDSNTTNTVGELTLYCTATNTDPGIFKWQVVNYLPADVVSWAGDGGAGVLTSGTLPAVSVQKWQGNNLATPLRSGYPLTDGTGAMYATSVASANTTSVTLDAGPSQDDIFKGAFLFLNDNFGRHVGYPISAYDGTAKVITLAKALPFTPTGTITAAISSMPANIFTWQDTVPNALVSNRVDSKMSAIANGVAAADVLNATASTYNTANTIGRQINVSGTAADPWNTNVSVYPSNTAGYLLYTRGDATLANQSTIISYLQATGATLTIPVAGGGSVSLYQGDAYSNTDGRALIWTVTNYSGPAANTLSVRLTATKSTDYYSTNTNTTPDLNTTGTASQSNTTLTLMVELNTTQTAALRSVPPDTAPNYIYSVRATVGNTTRVITDITGTMTVNRVG